MVKSCRIQPLLNSVANSQGTGGEVVIAQVCKTCMRGFNSRSVLQIQRYHQE